MKIPNKRDYMIRISGRHYFACDYVISNIYGESVFFEDEDKAPPVDAPLMTREIMEENLKQTLPETPLGGLFTLPDCSKEIRFASSGTVKRVKGDGVYVRYGSDEHPMCLHIREDGAVTVSNDEEDLGELVFENGKKTLIALQASVFNDFSPLDVPEDDDMHSPLHLGLRTEELRGRISERGGKLRIRYAIDVNGVLAEITDFTLTAGRLGRADGVRTDRRAAERNVL